MVGEPNEKYEEADSLDENIVQPGKINQADTNVQTENVTSEQEEELQKKGEDGEMK